MDTGCSLTVAGLAPRQLLEFQRQIRESPLPFQSLLFCGWWGGNVSGEDSEDISKTKGKKAIDKYSNKDTPNSHRKAKANGASTY